MGASVLLVAPSIAYANIGVPMLLVTLPGMLIALVPIIAVESYVISKQLSLALGRAVKTCSIANLASTLVGIPVAWFVLVVIQIATGGGSAHGIDTPLEKFLAVTWQAPWLIPYEPELYWMIPAATLTLLVPFFFASWFIEYRVSKRFLKENDASLVNKAVRDANLLSYALLAVAVLCFLAAAEPTQR